PPPCGTDLEASRLYQSALLAHLCRGWRPARRTDRKDRSVRQDTMARGLRHPRSRAFRLDDERGMPGGLIGYIGSMATAWHGGAPAWTAGAAEADGCPTARSQAHRTDRVPR